MSNDDQQSPPPTRARRSSFAGQTFADLFGTGRQSVSRPAPANNTDTNSSSPPTQQMPGPITQAAANAQRRRLSVTTLGLSGSPNQSSPFNSFRGRRESISSANSGSIDESAVAEDNADPTVGSPPTTPFARRTSFGARALRDIRTSSFGGGGGGGGSPGQNGTRSPPATSSHSSSGKAQQQQNGTISARDAKGRGSSSEGFNWSDNFRTRAERTSSIAGPAGGGLPVGGIGHDRSKSVAVMEPPPAAEIPRPKEQKRPDHFQERILKGDFYMD